MSNLNSIQEILNSMVNRYPECGGIEAHDPLSQEYGFDVAPQPTDVVIFVDFDDDNVESEGERNALAEWYNDTLHTNIERQMRMFGYQAIAGNDGSGGGLYYGATLFRKVEEGLPLD